VSAAREDEAELVVRLDTPIRIEGDELPSTEELHRFVREARPRQRLIVESVPRPGLTSRGVLAAIGIYQRFVSPRLRRRCLLEPSCSRYAELAIAHNGLIRGGAETRRRLSRCRPKNEGKVDYPEGVQICLTK